MPLASAVVALAEAVVLIGQNLIHRRSPQVAVGEVVVDVEGQDHVRAIEDVMLCACSVLPVTVRPIRQR